MATDHHASDEIVPVLDEEAGGAGQPHQGGLEALRTGPALPAIRATSRAATEPPEAPEAPEAEDTFQPGDATGPLAPSPSRLNAALLFDLEETQDEARGLTTGETPLTEVAPPTTIDEGIAAQRLERLERAIQRLVGASKLNDEAELRQAIDDGAAVFEHETPFVDVARAATGGGEARDKLLDAFFRLQRLLDLAQRSPTVSGLQAAVSATLAPKRSTLAPKAAPAEELRPAAPRSEAPDRRKTMLIVFAVLVVARLAYLPFELSDDSPPAAAVPEQHVHSEHAAAVHNKSEPKEDEPAVDAVELANEAGGLALVVMARSPRGRDLRVEITWYKNGGVIRETTEPCAGELVVKLPQDLLQEGAKYKASVRASDGQQRSTRLTTAEVAYKPAPPPRRR
ncbi:MAG: hypothetical protein IT371_28570 [Deltaproteobacteria bacterium]|nr:hypothetical protein [Deltaproteobacteria bacterium]